MSSITIRSRASSFVAAVAALGCGAAMAGQQSQLTIANSCGFKIWIQQLNVNGAPVVVPIAAGDSYTYQIVTKGDQSTRFWPKAGCNATGWNCDIGESQGQPNGSGGYTCPPGGCSPPVDSKIEVNWACVDGSNQCGDVAQAKSYYDISQVDGFTLPFKIAASGTVQNPACEPTVCSGLDMKGDCPTSEDLSSNGQFPNLKNVDLRVRDPKTKAVIGCYSPCEKLTYSANFGGLGYLPQSPQAQLYCCPTPPVSSPQCNAGPVPKTSFVQYVHKVCNDRAYAFAYDDADGNHACQGIVTINMEVCPK
jgi:hypothetical protein